MDIKNTIATTELSELSNGGKITHVLVKQSKNVFTKLCSEYEITTFDELKSALYENMAKVNPTVRGYTALLSHKMIAYGKYSSSKDIPALHELKCSIRAERLHILQIATSQDGSFTEEDIATIKHYTRPSDILITGLTIVKGVRGLQSEWLADEFVSDTIRATNCSRSYSEYSICTLPEIEKSIDSTFDIFRTTKDPFESIRAMLEQPTSMSITLCYYQPKDIKIIPGVELANKIKRSEKAQIAGKKRALTRQAEKDMMQPIIASIFSKHGYHLNKYGKNKISISFEKIRKLLEADLVNVMKELEENGIFLTDANKRAYDKRYPVQMPFTIFELSAFTTKIKGEQS